MSEIRVNDIIGEDGSSSVGFSKGINISSGVVTATTFKGAFDGDGSSLTGVASTDNIITGTAATFTSGIDVVGAAVTIHNKGIDVAGIITSTGGFSGNATSATNASGLTGTPSIVVQDITAEMVSIAGTMQYEDVVSVDSVGIVTARDGIRIGTGGTVGPSASGIVTYYGDGSNLTGVVSGTELKQAGTSVGTAVTQINFASGATLTTASLGISTVTIAAGGITTASYTVTNGNTATLNLDSAQDHLVTTTGTTTINCSGGTTGDSHIIRVLNSGSSTVGFSTYFLWPSGITPALPTATQAISLVSFTVNRQGTAGIGTQLLAGVSLNYS